MDDFASFVPSGKKDGAEGEEWMREAEKLLASCKGKSERELLGEIYARAVEGRRAGTLTDEQIDLFCSRIAPLLDGGKRKRLKKIAEELKKL